MQEQKPRITLKRLVEDKNRAELFATLPLEEQAETVDKLPKSTQKELLINLPKEKSLMLLEHLDPDDATDMLQLLPKNLRDDLLRELGEELQRVITLLLEFDPQSASRLMSLDYIQADVDDTIEEITSFIRTHEKNTGKVPEVLVLEEGKLKGFLPIQRLITGSPHDKARDYIKRIETIKSNTKRKAVIKTFMEKQHQKLVVINETGNILGIIYSDDVLRAIHEKEASTLYDFAGVSNEETIFGSVKQKVRYRYKWLMINLATAFLAAFTVSLFEDTISKYVLLAVYMPIVAGMGGNAATQTLAVIVRGIALKQIDLATAWPTLKKELQAALINGLINGVLVAGVVIAFNRDLGVALILAAAMIINLLVAGFFGTLVPLIMERLHKDPATSATIFITTATDVLGFLAFLGLASLLL